MWGVYITDSLFKGFHFEKRNFSEAELYSCQFEEVIFQSTDAVFENVIFTMCELNDVFSYAKVRNIEFKNSNFKGIDFWKCIIDKLKFVNMSFDMDSLIRELNIGSLEKPLYINSERAISFLRKRVNYGSLTEKLLCTQKRTQ